MNAPAGTVVDSSVLLDIFTEDPVWGEWSLGQLTGAAQRGGLILNAVVMAEIAHAAVTGRPLLTRDPQRVATHIPGARLIAAEQLS